jgi:2-polyprenyl-6-methoxyphenol hydroxylase-like FAD-dependent oxidoreductase
VAGGGEDVTSGPDVLVVGAGPTGLALALQAYEHGVRVRIVERRPEVFRPSRALIVHSRTLETLRPLGVVDDLLARADTAPRVCLHLGARRVPVRLGGFALPDTPFAHLSLISQLDVETVLSQALADRGVAVEWAVELTGLDRGDRTPDGVRVVLRSAKGAEAATYRFWSTAGRYACTS